MSMEESRENIIQLVQKTVQPVLDSLGLELVEVVFGFGGRSALLRLFIDKPDGVTLNDCERVSRFLGTALDVEDPILTRYTLEVSSPGLDRPLKKQDDFRRFQGKLVRIKTHEPVEGQQLLIGRLADYEESGIQIILKEGKTVKIPFQNIEKARLEVEF